MNCDRSDPRPVATLPTGVSCYTVNFFFTVPRLVYHVFTLIRVKRDKERD